MNILSAHFGVIALLALGATCPAARGGEESAALGTAHRTDEDLRIDGVLDEAAWSECTAISAFRQVSPDPGAPATEETVVRIVRTDSSVYIGIRCFDRAPNEIAALTMQRDALLAADDHLLIVIDPYRDRRYGYLFEVNPLGAMADSLISFSTRPNRDWDGLWDAAATIDELGWSAEVEIPVATISFGMGLDEWGLNVQRFIRRKNETDRWATPDPARAFTSIGDAGTVSGMAGLRQHANVDVRPYLLGRLTHDARSSDTDLTGDAGVDLLWRPSPEFNVTLTTNTDFAETEIDDRRVNLTRFPLLFPEKRDFFLQDANTFGFGGIRSNPIPFHSRRIGIGSDGRRRDILAGAKVTGRTGGVNYGLLDVQMRHDAKLGHKNLAVGRVALNVLDESSVGVIATAGDPTRRGDNFVAGADFNYRSTDLIPDRVLEAHAWVIGSDGEGESSDGSSYGGRIEYPNEPIGWTFGHTRIGETFDPALGFVSRRGIREWFADWTYRFRPGGAIRTLDVGPSVFLTTGLKDSIESAQWTLKLAEMELDAGDTIDARVLQLREVLDLPFEIFDGVSIPAGRYDFSRVSINYVGSGARPLALDLETSVGEFYDGHRADINAALAWRVSPGLRLSAGYEINAVSLPAGDFTVRIITGGLTASFSPRLTWSIIGQYDNESELLGFNSRVRWTVAPGDEVFFVVNQDLLREDRRFATERTEVITKVGLTIRF